MLSLKSSTLERQMEVSDMGVHVMYLSHEGNASCDNMKSRCPKKVQVAF